MSEHPKCWKCLTCGIKIPYWEVWYHKMAEHKIEEIVDE